MKPTKAFILLSIVAYLACIMLTVLGKPPLPDTHPGVQGAVYFLLAVLLFFTFDGDAPQGNGAKVLWAFVYGTGAMVAFTGAVHWAGGDNAGFFMCLWDLTLGVALLMD